MGGPAHAEPEVATPSRQSLRARNTSTCPTIVEILALFGHVEADDLVATVTADNGALGVVNCAAPGCAHRFGAL